ncbi:MAG: ribosome maturation factor RimP [Mycobacterium sp.]
MTERSNGLPSPHQVIELLDGEFGRAGYEIEDVRLDAATRPARVAVIVDGDTPLTLDAVAELSRIAAELLEKLPESTDPYLLEVTSPGVDRPLSTEKQYRRAHGRKVELDLVDGEQVTGRIAAVSSRDGAGVVRLVVGNGVKGSGKWSVREFALSDIAKAVVQVDFSPPSARELEMVGQAGETAGAAGTEAEA